MHYITHSLITHFIAPFCGTLITLLSLTAVSTKYRVSLYRHLKVRVNVVYNNTQSENSHFQVMYLTVALTDTQHPYKTF